MVLELWFSEWGLWASNISITWELVRDAKLRPHPGPTESETLGGAQQSVFQPALQGILMRFKFENCSVLAEGSLQNT